MSINRGKKGEWCHTCRVQALRYSSCPHYLYLCRGLSLSLSDFSYSRSKNKSTTTAKQQIELVLQVVQSL